MVPGRMVPPMQVKIRPTRLALSGQLNTGQTKNSFLAKVGGALRAAAGRLLRNS